MEQELALKYEKLQQRLKELGKLVVSFSGGVDSTFLLAAAQEAIGDQVTAVTAAGRSVPEREIEEAKEFCRERGIRHIVFAFDELEVKGFADNPPDRCYHCKTAILQKVREAAEQVDTVQIAEGSNMDDDGDYRPGKRAVKEAGVISPLREAGLTKAEIRQLSKEMGLETWDKPSFACLASRFAYEEPITAEKLRMVELAEEFLREHGFSQYRVRMHGSMARVEVLPEDLERFLDPDLRKDFTAHMKELGFTYTALDLDGYRTGSMNAVLEEKA